MLLRLYPEEMNTSRLTPLPPTLPAMYLFLMWSLSVDYPSYLALSTQMTEDDAFFVQTCVEEVENAEYVAPLKPLLSMRVEDPVDEELDPRSRLSEYVDSKRKLVAKKLCYAKSTRSSWPLKQGRMGDLSELKEDPEQKITTWQREVDLKLMKSVWGADVRTPKEEDLSEKCVCERAYVAIVHQRWLNETYYMPTKG